MLPFLLVALTIPSQAFAAEPNPSVVTAYRVNQGLPPCEGLEKMPTAASYAPDPAACPGTANLKAALLNLEKTMREDCHALAATYGDRARSGRTPREVGGNSLTLSNLLAQRGKFDLAVEATLAAAPGARERANPACRVLAEEMESLTMGDRKVAILHYDNLLSFLLDAQAGDPQAAPTYLDYLDHGDRRFR